MWDGPGVRFKHKGSDGVPPWGYKHHPQAHTAVGSWTLNTVDLSLLREGIWPGGAQLRLPGTAPGSSGGTEGPWLRALSSTQPGSRQPRALVQMKEKQGEEKPSQELQSDV